MAGTTERIIDRLHPPLQDNTCVGIIVYIYARVRQVFSPPAVLAEFPERADVPLMRKLVRFRPQIAPECKQTNTYNHQDACIVLVTTRVHASTDMCTVVTPGYLSCV